MKVILVIGRTGCGKTTLTTTLCKRPALIIPHSSLFKIEKRHYKYKTLIFDDIGLHPRENLEVLEWIVHYGRRFWDEIWIIGHYFAQVPSNIRSAATQLWIGRLDKNLLPAQYQKLEIPETDMVFYGYGDDTRKIRLHLTK